MRKRFLLLSVGYCLLHFSATGQQILPAAVNNAGGTYTGSTVKIDWSIGETMIQTLADGSILTLGVLQPATSISGGSLPVSWLDFYATRTNQQLVSLQWETAQEFNNTGFYIERKTGQDNQFVQVRFVPSKAPGGNSQSRIGYAVQDSNAFSGTTLYRLRQVDIDGRISWSPVRSVQGMTDQLQQLKIWPVPSNGLVYFTASGTKQDTYEVFDASGRMIRKGRFSTGQPTTINGLQKGVYILRIADEKMISRQFIIQ